MIDIEQYLNDGANEQAVAVMAFLRGRNFVKLKI